MDRLFEDYQILSTYFLSFQSYFNLVASASTSPMISPHMSFSSTAIVQPPPQANRQSINRFRRFTQSSKTIPEITQLSMDERPVLGMETYLKPWNDILKTLTLDTRALPEFVRTELYRSAQLPLFVPSIIVMTSLFWFRDFGSCTVKVWQTLMNMRGENKKVVDVMYDLVMKQWNPPSISPLIVISYQVMISLTTLHVNDLIIIILLGQTEIEAIESM